MEDEISSYQPAMGNGKEVSRPSQDVTLSGNIMKPSTGKFGFSRSQLHHLFKSRSISLFQEFGGLSGLAAGLRTDVRLGLDQNENVLEGSVDMKGVLDKDSSESSTRASKQKSGTRFTDRRAAFGENRLPPRKRTSIWQFAWMAFNDKLMFLLAASATVSLALGIYQTTTSSEEGARFEWVEGVALWTAILVIVIASAANDFQKDRKFEKLNDKKEERYVTVTRSGEQQKIPVNDLLVGDVVHLETGDLLPTDGILIDGFGVQCDESSATGEADLIQKTPGSKIVAEGNKPSEQDPFILSGAEVSSGVGHYLVTSTGPDTTYGKILLSLRTEVHETPLQHKLGILAKYIVNFGLIAGVLFFIILFIRYLTQLSSMDGAGEKGQRFLDIFIITITVIVIAVPEGLPLAVTLALAFATTRMLKDNNLVRLLRSCEIMGNATTICSDKTGTLTEGRMCVVACIIGPRKFRDSHTLKDPTSSNDSEKGVNHSDFIELTKLPSTICESVKDLLNQSIASNSTAAEKGEEGATHFVGSTTETALLRFARDSLSLGPLLEEREKVEVVKLYPFDADKKSMAVVVKTGDGRYRMLVKGAAEVILKNCTQILAAPGDNVTTNVLGQEVMDDLEATVHSYASQSLRPLGLAYREFEKWSDDGKATDFESLFGEMTFVGIFGLKDPLRPEAVESVKQCQSAGVFVRMVTGDNLHTAKAIAKECGIYTAGGVAMDGPTFRNLSEEQLDLVVPRLQVLARSSPEDKKTLVLHLQRMNETVAVTGDGTNDALALKAADIGFAMGITGTEVAKEAASIILMDDNFGSILKALLWGRQVSDSAKQFIQFQFTINVSAGFLMVLSVIIGGEEASVFTIVQLLWINLIMDTFAALSLSTDYPSKDLLKRKPEPRSASILNTRMWKLIIVQALYQIIVMFTLHYGGSAIFHYGTEDQLTQLQTMIFNTYVWMQIANQINSRRVDNKLNVLEGAHRNTWFLSVISLTAAGQIVIIVVGGPAFRTVPLTGVQWAISLILGFLALPLGVLIRLTPDRFAEAIYAFLKKCIPLHKLAHFKKRDHEATSPKITKFCRLLVRPFRVRGKLQDSILPTSGELKPGTPNSEVSRVDIDLARAIETARQSEAGFDGLEVHPDTIREDPVLIEGLIESHWPPSQNPVLERYFKAAPIAEP